jgi:hypothetical protein
VRRVEAAVEADLKVEPRILGRRDAAADLGEVTEEVIQGGHESFRLVKVTH